MFFSKDIDSGVFNHPGKFVLTEMITFLVIFFGNGKLFLSLLSLLLGVDNENS